jgi:hypothetical protein
MSKIHFNQQQQSSFLYLAPLALLSVAAIMRRSRVSVNPIASSSSLAFNNASLMHQTRTLQAASAGSFGANN